MEAVWWAGLSVVIVFALMSFTPVLSLVLLGKALLGTLLHLSQPHLKAIAGGTNRWFYPPVMLLQESAFWVLAGLASVSTFIGSLAKR